MYEDREPVFDAADKSYIDDNDFVNYRVNEANKRLNLVSCDKEINYKESPEVHKPKSSKMNTKLYKKQLQYNLPDRISEEKDFIIYEISDPELWYSAQAQLFEKLSTPEGKTVWNDLTKDETACVNSVNPEWSNQDVDIQYKSADFLAREDYRLPRPDLCLVVPIKQDHENGTKVVLLNDDDKSIALRDVRIKRDDRCFCVWHCDCVCLGEDPKLLCRDMSAAQLLAAGLSAQQKSRHARSVCYPDIVTLNLFVTFIGVLIALLILGLLKALLGLACRCVATWGLHRFLETPRKLDHYYERSLRNRRVLYDDEGWPIHPDTKERTVGLVSEPMEFILNVIFFVTLPCLMLWDAMRKLCRCQRLDGNSELNYKMDEDVKRCFSSHDVQVTKRQLRRRRRELHRWMTPQAEELTAGIWQKGLSTLGEKTRVYLPLLQDKSGFRKTCEHSSYIDSEQDDTEYVLMQMQKSRESLARSQQQLETKTCKEITNVDDVNR
ncbi:jg24527 [Pararge aegeria aegeria]|uniref:Jg24527 protein n=1 Tax=Pararge aegeria aegeria TaxID=348720 RepID=A0A8S4R3K7_9NEOP|nr:jg24527 [Pararge aegeria aegeria]